MQHSMQDAIEKHIRRSSNRGKFVFKENDHRLPVSENVDWKAKLSKSQLSCIMEPLRYPLSIYL